MFQNFVLALWTAIVTGRYGGHIGGTVRALR
jgi:hypothetical protein